MLEPATRLPSAAGHRELAPSFGCSVQPNRTLPLRPAPPLPRRKSVSVVWAAATQHKVSRNEVPEVKATESTTKADAAAQERPDAGVESYDKSEYDIREQVQEVQGSRASSSLDSPPNVVAEKSPSSNKKRNSLCLRTIKTNGEESEVAKTVPPLRLKKISKFQDEPSWAARTISTAEPVAEKDPGECALVTRDEVTSFDQMASEKSRDSGSVKSIEIVIPSMPELGIKETRTDRISLPRETVPSKSFVINYILGKDTQPSSVPMNIRIPTMASSSAENTGPVGHEEHKSSRNLNREHGQSETSNNRFQSSPLPGSDDPCDVAIFSEPADKCPKISDGKKCDDWLLRREQLCKKYRDVRAKIIERHQKISASGCFLGENEEPGVRFQESIDSFDRSINHYTSVLKKLSDIGTSLAFENCSEEMQKNIEFLDKEMLEEGSSFMSEHTKLAKKIVRSPNDDVRGESKNERDRQRTLNILKDTGLVEEAYKNYNYPTSEAQESEKITSHIKPSANTDKVATTEALDLKKKIQLHQNGYSRISSDYDAFKSMPILPHSDHIKTNQSTKDSQVDAFTCNSRELLPQNPEHLRNYSSYLANQLNVAPTSTNTLLAAVLRPMTYPPHSRETLESWAPSNSPREALIPNSIPGAWSDHQHPLNNPSTTITDIDAMRHRHYHHHHQQQQQQYQHHHQQQQQQQHQQQQQQQHQRQQLQQQQQQQQRHRYQLQQREEAQMYNDIKKPLDLAIKSRKKYAQQEKYQYQSETEDKKKRQRVWNTTSPWTSAQTTFNRRLSPGDQRESYPEQVYAYGTHEAGSWNPAPMLARSQEFAHPLGCRTLAHGDKYGAADNVLGVQRMYEGAATAEQVKIQESMEPHKPEVKDNQADASKVEAGKPTSRSAHETHIESEQFPTLGNWVASLIGKQTSESTSTRLVQDVIGRQSFYQPQSPSTESYKSTADPASTGAVANNYMGNSYASIPGRWTTDQQQTGRSSQQDQLPGARFLPRQPTFHPPITPTSAALSYSAKYSANLYQSPVLLGYNALYPYVTSMTYSRLPSEASLGQQRVSPFAPLESRFYSEVGDVRMGKQIDYVEQQSQYARMFTPRELDTYKQQRTVQQRPKIVSPEVSRAGIAKQFKSGVPYGRGSSNDTTPSTPSPIFTGSSDASSSHQHHQQQQQQPQPSQPPPQPQQDNPETMLNLPASLGEVRKRPGQNLRCSNCGALGSHFECLGCETAVYCNELCQTQHWSIHVIQCPKIMPKLKKVG